MSKVSSSERATEVGGQSKSLIFPIIFLSGLSGLLSLRSLGGFIFSFHNSLRGDLLMRSEELRYVLHGVDPATVNADLGYPAWAYITSMLWFLPFGVGNSMNFYLFIQLAILCSVGAFLVARLKSSLHLKWRLLLLLGAMPWFPVREQANFLNYGIIVLGGLTVFVFSHNLVFKGFGLALALIKPSLCLPAIIVSLFRYPNFRSMVTPLIVATSAIAAQAAAALSLYSGGVNSLSSIFARYLPGNTKANPFFVSGDYGVLNKLVKSEIISEQLSMLLLVVGVVSLLYYLKYCSPNRLNDDLDFQILSFGLIPLFTFHRSHDLIVVWPAIYLMLLRVCEMGRDKQILVVPIILFAIYYRGSGGGSLYLYAIAIALCLFVKDPPPLISRIFPALK